MFSQSELDPLDFGFALGRCPRSSEEKQLLTWMTPFLLHTIGFEDVKSLQPDSNVISEAMSFQVKVLVGLLALAKLLLGYSRQGLENPRRAHPARVTPP